MYLIVDFRGFVNTNGPQQISHPHQDLRLYHREKLINRFRLLRVQFSGLEIYGLVIFRRAPDDGWLELRSDPTLGLSKILSGETPIANCQVFA
jgi:hypothetical protein